MSDETGSSFENASDGFAVPKIPFKLPSKKPIVQSNSSDKQLIQHSSDHQSTSHLEQQEIVKTIPPPLTNLQPTSDVFFVEVIKDGAVVTRHYLNKNCLTIGRAVDCDLIFEHCSISRYHAALYWKENNQNVNDHGFFYLTDLNSSHGTFHNKIQLEKNKFLKLEPNKSFIKLGASSRLLLFSTIDNNEDDYDDSQVSLDSQMIGSIDEKEQMNSENLGCTWGMDLDYDSSRRTLYSQSSSGLQTVLSIINENTVIDKTENENAYSANPQNVIMKWFDYEGYEYEYTMTNEHNKFKCQIEFPIEDQHVPISGEDEIKKKDAINSACLRACRILDKACLLFPWQKNRRFEKRQGSDDEDDDDGLIDETGEKESKKIRLEALKNRKVENLDTLNKRFDELKTEIEALKVEINEIDQEIGLSKTGSHERNDDELDQYMKTMSSRKFNLNDLKIKKSKARMKMSQLNKEKERTEKLIKIAQPIQGSYKVKEVIKSNKVNELLEKAKAKLNEKKVESMESKSIPDAAIKPSVFREDEQVDVVEEKKSKGFKFNKPRTLSKPSTFDEDDELVKKRKLSLIDLDDEEEVKKTNSDKTNLKDAKLENTIKSSKEMISDKDVKKSTEPAKFKKQLILRRDEDELVEDDKYSEWSVPPDQDEESDRSHLNERYGY